MNRANRTTLYRLLLAELKGARLPWAALRGRLIELAEANNIKFTWKNVDSEANNLANELSTLLDVMQQLPRDSASGFEAPASAALFERTQPRTRPSDQMMDFTQLFRDGDSTPPGALRRRLKALTEQRSDFVGTIESFLLERLLDRATSEPFGTPLAFIEDPQLGILDAEEVAAMYARATGS